MSDNKAFRSTVSYLIVRDLVHEKAFAKALTTLGVVWAKTMPIPKIETSFMPEVREMEKKNLHNQIWTFSNEPSEVSKTCTNQMYEQVSHAHPEAL
jgi:Mn-containing catalase